MKKLDITPTPQGYERMKRIFETEREQAKENIERACRMLGDLSAVFEPDDREIFEKAMNIYVEHEEIRIASFEPKKEG